MRRYRGHCEELLESIFNLILCRIYLLITKYSECKACSVLKSITLDANNGVYVLRMTNNALHAQHTQIPVKSNFEIAIAFVVAANRKLFHPVVIKPFAQSDPLD